MSGNGWFWAGVVVWGLSWFLPAFGVGAEGLDLASFSGYRAFRFAWEASWEGGELRRDPLATVQLDRGSDDEPARMRATTRRSGPRDPIDRLLPWTWALNLAMLVALGMR